MTTARRDLFLLGSVPAATIFVFIAVVSIGSAFSQPVQQPPDVATLQKAIAVIQAQRNQAFDAQAGAEVRAATLAEENARLKAQVQALEAKLPKPEPEEKKP